MNPLVFAMVILRNIIFKRRTFNFGAWVGTSSGGGGQGGTIRYITRFLSNAITIGLVRKGLSWNGLLQKLKGSMGLEIHYFELPGATWSVQSMKGQQNMRKHIVGYLGEPSWRLPLSNSCSIWDPPGII